MLKVRNKFVEGAVYDNGFPESELECELLTCHYTGALIVQRDAIVLGPVVPQSPVSYFCHPLAGPARTKSVHLFDETEQNCNTCKFLIRVPFKKDGSGLIPGICTNPDRKPLYDRGNGKILFAPQDCMLQECYEGRV